MARKKAKRLGSKVLEGVRYVQRWVKVAPHDRTAGHRRRVWLKDTPERVSMAAPPKGKWGRGRPFETRTVLRDKATGHRLDPKALKAYLKAHPSYRKQVERARVYVSKVTGKEVSKETAFQRRYRFVSRKTGLPVDPRWAKTHRSRVVKQAVFAPRRWDTLAWREAHPRATKKQLIAIKRTLKGYASKRLDPKKSPNLKRYISWLEKFRPLMYVRLRQQGLLGAAIRPTSFEEALRAHGMR